MTDQDLQGLHDRATRGEELNADERAALEAWYAQQDQAESQLLLEQTSSDAHTQLCTQIATAATQLETVSQHIRETLDQNDQARREIALLTLQLNRNL